MVERSQQRPPIEGSSAHLFDAVEPENARRLLAAAVEVFASRGYHATTTREIARLAGLSRAGVYVHFRSKAELLLAVSRAGHDAVLSLCENAVSAGTGPDDRLSCFMRAFAGWHAQNHSVARVIQYELRSLPQPGFEQIRVLRHEFDRMVQTELSKGNEIGVFDVDDVEGTTLAILSLGVDIARWYSPTFSRSPAAIGELYANLVSAMVRSKPGAAVAIPGPDESRLAEPGPIS